MAEALAASCEMLWTSRRKISDHKKFVCRSGDAAWGVVKEQPSQTAISVPAPSPFERYPHFYPQAGTLNLDNGRRNSVHNLHGDIFVNNSPQIGIPHALLDRKCT